MYWMTLSLAIANAYYGPRPIGLIERFNNRGNQRQIPSTAVGSDCRKDQQAGRKALHTGKFLDPDRILSHKVCTAQIGPARQGEENLTYS